MTVSSLAAPPTVEMHVKAMPEGLSNSQHVVDSRGVEWVIKPARQNDLGCHRTVTEFIAGSLVEDLGLTTPGVSAVFLPKDLIDAEPALRTFTPGYVLGVRHLPGMSLTTARILGQDVAHRMDSAASRFTAVATTLTDTWLWNADRSPGSYNGNFGSNQGNLFIQTPAEGPWSLTIIDFDRAFYGAQWGAWRNGPWPPAVLGTMSYFFNNQLLPTDQAEFMDACEPLLTTIEELDISQRLSDVRSRLPAEWTDGTHADPIDNTQFVDLLGHLEQQRDRLRSTLRTHYGDAVRRWGGI